MQFTITEGDNRDTLKNYPDNYFDSIITDPPYGIDFLGKSWDANTGALETYQECLRVLKPGGHILAFSAARTYHHLAITLEQAGFEIRDQIMWIYASGFPKAQDLGKMADSRILKGNASTRSQRQMAMGNDYTEVGHYTVHSGDKESKLAQASKDNSKGTNWTPQTPEAQQWAGWKTALKPAHEPICMARKPFKGSAIDNVLEHGVGALNIDATRIDFNGDKPTYWAATNTYQKTQQMNNTGEYEKNVCLGQVENPNTGRFPSNVIGDIPDYQKYFYCPKVSRRERHCGFEALPPSAGTTKMYGPEQAVTRNTANLGGDKVGKNAKKHDPLGHIPTSKGGMWDVDGTGVQYNANKGNLGHIPTGNNFGDGLASGKKLHKTRDPLAHIPTQAKMLNHMGGHYIDAPINQNVWLPNIGNIKIHGLKHEYEEWCKNNKPTGNVGNNHPTVKPVDLMRYLIKLVTPPNGKVLDPFCGSGSTGMAAVELGHEFTGCELDPAYVKIAQTRIGAWNTEEPSGTTYEDLFQELK